MTINACLLTLWVIAIALSNALVAQEILPSYKRMAMNIGGPDWVVKSTDGTACGYEVEAWAKIATDNQRTSERSFQAVLRIKTGTLQLEYPAHDLNDGANELASGIGIRREGKKIELLCKMPKEVLIVPLSPEAFQKLKQISADARRTAVAMNNHWAGIVRDFEAVAKATRGADPESE